MEAIQHTSEEILGCLEQSTATHSLSLSWSCILRIHLLNKEKEFYTLK